MLQGITIMTDKNSDFYLTDHAKKLLAVLQDKSGEWLTRSYIAKAMKRNRLTPYDNQLLDNMVDAELLQKRLSTHGVLHYEYKVVDPPNDSD